MVLRTSRHVKLQVRGVVGKMTDGSRSRGMTSFMDKTLPVHSFILLHTTSESLSSSKRTL